MTNRVKWDTNLLENLKPDVFGPVRNDGGEQKSLEFTETENHALMQAHTSCRSRLTVGVSCVCQVIQTTLQRELEVGAKQVLEKKSSTAAGNKNLKLTSGSAF